MLYSCYILMILSRLDLAFLKFVLQLEALSCTEALESVRLSSQFFNYNKYKPKNPSLFFIKNAVKRTTSAVF
jgi:hypothetical protein